MSEHVTPGQFIPPYGGALDPYDGHFSPEDYVNFNRELGSAECYLSDFFYFRARWNEQLQEWIKLPTFKEFYRLLRIQTYIEYNLYKYLEYYPLGDYEPSRNGGVLNA